MPDGVLDTAGKDEKKEPIWKAFLQAYSELGDFGKACKAIGVSHTTVRRALKNVKEFSDLYEEAKQVLADRIEDALNKRAIEGIRTLKFDKNGVACTDPKTGEPYEEMKFSDVAAIVRLKALRPNEYIEKRQIMGPDGGPLEMKVTSLADLVRLATHEDPTKKEKPVVMHEEKMAR